MSRSIGPRFATPFIRTRTLQELALRQYYLDPTAYTQLWMDTEIRMKPIPKNRQQK
jgi:hypothetical protein